MFNLFSSPKPPPKGDPESITIDIPLHDAHLLQHLELNKHNCVVAGGAALLWYQNLAVLKHDIDLWFKSKNDIEGMKFHLLNSEHFSGARVIFNTNNATTIECQCRGVDYRIQLISRTYDTVEQLLETFDITVTKVATDGNNWFIGQHFAEDLRHRRLRIPQYNSAVVRRLFKYATYGYTPSNELLDQIINDPTVNWDFSTEYGTDEYENAF